MERITEDANFSDKIVISHFSHGDKVVIKYRNKAQAEEKDFNEIYYAQEDAPTNNLSRIIVNNANAPMTGDSELGNVHILSFKVKKISAHIVSIELEGISRVTKHKYKLKSAAYAQGEIIDNN